MLRSSTGSVRTLVKLAEADLITSYVAGRCLLLSTNGLLSLIFLRVGFYLASDDLISSGLNAPMDMSTEGSREVLRNIIWLSQFQPGVGLSESKGAGEGR